LWKGGEGTNEQSSGLNLSFTKKRKGNKKRVDSGERIGKKPTSRIAIEKKCQQKGKKRTQRLSRDEKRKTGGLRKQMVTRTNLILQLPRAVWGTHEKRKLARKKKHDKKGKKKLKN